MPDIDPPGLAGEEVAALRAAVLVLGRRLRQQAAGEEISAAEMSVLGRVFRDGEQTPGRLAKAEHVQPPSMTRTIERLVGRGYLQRTPHPEDGRQHLVSLTETGRQVIAETRSLRNRWLAEHAGQLTAGERRALRSAIPALARLAELP